MKKFARLDISSILFNGSDVLMANFSENSLMNRNKTATEALESMIYDLPNGIDFDIFQTHSNATFLSICITTADRIRLK